MDIALKQTVENVDIASVKQTMEIADVKQTVEKLGNVFIKKTQEN